VLNDYHSLSWLIKNVFSSISSHYSKHVSNLKDNRQMNILCLQQITARSAPLMMVIAMSLWVKRSAYIYDNVTLCQNCRVPGPNNLSVLRKEQKESQILHQERSFKNIVNTSDQNASSEFGNSRPLPITSEGP